MKHYTTSHGLALFSRLLGFALSDNFYIFKSRDVEQ